MKYRTMLHLVPLFMWVWQSVKHPSFPSSITLVHSSLQVQWHLSQTELWHKWHLSLAEKITIPRIEVPRDPNFKYLCQKEPACKGKTFVPSRFSCMRFSLYSLHLQVPCTENLICYVPFILSRSVIMFSLSVFSIIISKPWSHLIIAYKYHRSWYLFFLFPDLPYSKPLKMVSVRELFEVYQILILICYLDKHPEFIIFFLVRLS
jgi:hypothetical protein